MIIKNFKRHSFSCGIISKLGNICNRIFNIYIDGKIDNQIIKSFIQKDVSKEDSWPKKNYFYQDIQKY